ncbi:uncharacterized protein LOC106658456 isoform X1 [Trichogramma pretiosum]|uniref:uncharacterized protein LOC106658456 isoform X1 n=1 Tax=Trichogramma pretiosum TaxID=7493 RepID=UPI000C71A2FE|nr:uncharacterized protein LOC106658456 isoform X1 [Trichogramma pretiosum]
MRHPAEKNLAGLATSTDGRNNDITNHPEFQEFQELLRVLSKGSVKSKSNSVPAKLRQKLAGISRLISTDLIREWRAYRTRSLLNPPIVSQDEENTAYEEKYPALQIVWSFYKNRNYEEKQSFLKYLRFCSGLSEEQLKCRKDKSAKKIYLKKNKHYERNLSAISEKAGSTQQIPNSNNNTFSIDPIGKKSTPTLEELKEKLYYATLYSQAEEYCLVTLSMDDIQLTAAEMYDRRLANFQAKFTDSLKELWDNGTIVSPGCEEDIQAKFTPRVKKLWDDGTDGSPGCSIWSNSVPVMDNSVWPGNHSSASFSNSALCQKIDKTADDENSDDSSILPLSVNSFVLGDSFDENKNEDDKTPQNRKNDRFEVEPTQEATWFYDNFDNNDALDRSDYSQACSLNCCKQFQSPEEAQQLKRIQCIEPVDEDLLTSDRTHFKPIKSDGHLTDGTTFSVDSEVEQIMYQSRSESERVFYLPGGETPYMNYSANEESSNSSALVPKFKVKQNNVATQTDFAEPIRVPAARRIFSTNYFAFDRTGQTANCSFNMWNSPEWQLRFERKRRLSCNFKTRPLAVLRPLTL